MNKENASKLWKMIQEAGDYLRGQLPDHPNHPKGRNPYAHVAICVKDYFNLTAIIVDGHASGLLNIVIRFCRRTR